MARKDDREYLVLAGWPTLAALVLIALALCEVINRLGTELVRILSWQ